MPGKADPDPALAAAIRQLRAGQNQEALADAAELHVTGLRRIEGGTADPKWSTIRRIAAALDMKPVEVVTLAEEMRKG